MSAFGKMLILLGIFLIIFGAIFTLGGKIPWLGRLPGDICIQKKGVTFFFPITTSILISIILSIILVLIRRR
ncbi:MAG: DUF2905 domain-containing protein [Candidatus Omnitrophica bacterium]|nr:DUF2905 domain-containing protein [Candidatus Omnitrophota bacterium]